MTEKLRREEEIEGKYQWLGKGKRREEKERGLESWRRVRKE